MIEKEPVTALHSRYLKNRLTVPVRAKTALAHIRYATIGNENYCNCHPFMRKDQNGRHWTLIHNGTIFDYPLLSRYAHCQTGETDSERILMHLVRQIDIVERDLGRMLSDDERAELLDDIITDMAEGNKLNLLLFDGTQLYVHTNYPHSLYLLHKYDGVLFATQPVSDEDWQPVPFTRLLVYRDGRQVYEGQQHDHVYVEDEENVRLLYMAFSDL